MQRLRLAVASHCLEMPLKQSLYRAAEMGVAGIQFDARSELKPADLSETGCRQLLHMVTELDLAVASLDFPLRRPLHDLDQLDARVNALKDAMRFAARLEARVVTVSTPIVSKADAAKEYELLLAVLNDLARHGNHVGVTLSLTTGQKAVEALKNVLSDVTEGPLGVNFDPSELVALGSSPADVYRDLHADVTQVLARDAVRDAGLGTEVSLGRGEVPWDEMLALFDESAYTGWVTIDRRQGDDKPGDAERAVQYLKRLAFG